MIQSVMELTEKNSSKTNEEEIQIVEFLPEHKQRFKEINVQWITRLYVMEVEDIKTVEDPEGYILKDGGKIFIALYKGYPVGTCAYLNLGNGVYEMIKMAVDENYRGLKIGKTIGEVSIQKIKELKPKKIILFSNRKGSAKAIKMYHKLGFVEVPLGTSEFTRADIRMEIVL
ncbi:MAG TPA: GNAT family N-acetyltransferase [Bacteroidia bacterium]|jgi:GNAT superfamily N-acetyltransferase|nr:GNAT family N-acetyltransferase [Bacteroidia bacterium]